MKEEIGEEIERVRRRQRRDLGGGAGEMRAGRQRRTRGRRRTEGRNEKRVKRIEEEAD